MKYKQRIVVKVGTNVMTNRDNRIVRPVLRNLVSQVAELYERDIITTLVSSGSVIAGREVLGKSKIKDKTQRRQVYSAIGQPRMMRLYYNIFHDYGMKCAQVLPTKRDFNPGIHRENMINCYEGLMSEGVIPIANEDDAVSVTMSMFSDNDELAGLVAQLLNVDKLILLTDTDGLYTGHPDDAGTELISHVSVDDDVDQFIKENGKGEAEGRGGMGSKLDFAQKTAAKNIPTFIANGKKPNVILDIMDGKNVGTKITMN
ncbi:MULTISPECIES: glutamate 5-kinase [Robiginitalea]|uniref:Glutamate 5-kinase n=1 Tax=Robiginitalea biformata (strain ATCC BAA-864 / DSM 15991 / KCTC 12146 / HTCC2501) TaxID=313596 RepID=A4CKE8_ROBBH|nr:MULTISPECIES: glutamate 5-kinase [Robiginitalea]EAR15347.1 gamma-glutamyl kinase [Robiginitalea biformata HTCC2501]MDC6353842.1 glutamate 5-kinase [Robiginitalea sp. PM2]MDC6374109.1 glutamate 5-kinase [Robiginitalea sp. SP8]